MLVVLRILTEVKEMVEFLQSKFSASVQPIYIIKELEANDLLEKRELSRLKVSKTVDGLRLLKVVVFKPTNHKSFKEEANTNEKVTEIAHRNFF